MVFTNEDKILVEVLRQDKGYSVKNWIDFLTSNDRCASWYGILGFNVPLDTV